MQGISIFAGRYNLPLQKNLCVIKHRFAKRKERNAFHSCNRLFLAPESPIFQFNQSLFRHEPREILRLVLPPLFSVNVLYLRDCRPAGVEL